MEDNEIHFYLDSKTIMQHPTISFKLSSSNRIEEKRQQITTQLFTLLPQLEVPHHNYNLSASSPELP